MTATVSPTVAQMREDIALFAATYPTPNVRRAVSLMGTGALSVEQVHSLFRDALAAGMAEVTR